MLPIAESAKPIRPANRDQGAWHANAYQRESALDLAKQLIRVTQPRADISDAALATALKNICKPAVAKLAELPARFESRRAFYDAVLVRAQFASNPAAREPNIAWALQVLSYIANVQFRDRSPAAWSKALLSSVTLPVERALLRWTGVNARQHGEGRHLDASQIAAFWDACLRAAAWQRAVNAVRHPQEQPVTPDQVNAMSVAEAFAAADEWRFNQPSSFITGGTMPKSTTTPNLFPLNDDDDKVITPDGIEVSAPKPTDALREPAAALGDEDESGEYPQQDEPLAPEPEDETPAVFRARLMQILHDAGVNNLAAAFKSATGYGNLDAAIGAGLTRAEIEAQIIAHTEMSKNAPSSAPKSQSHTETPKGGNERPAAPKSGQNSLALIPMGESAEASEFALQINQAQMFLKSGFLPASIRTVEQVVTIAAMGQQLGIAPIAAINGIDVIQGRPSIKAQLALALIYRSGQLQDLQVTDDGNTCTVVMTRKGMSPHTETFSMKDAAAMNLTGKDNWKKQPAVMRKWRTIAAAARIVFPDVIWGFGVRS